MIGYKQHVDLSQARYIFVKLLKTLTHRRCTVLHASSGNPEAFVVILTPVLTFANLKPLTFVGCKLWYLSAVYLLVLAQREGNSNHTLLTNL